MLEEISYTRESKILFARFAQYPWTIHLNSGYPNCEFGRYDILAIEPSKTLQSYNGLTQIREGDQLLMATKQNPLELIRNLLFTNKPLKLSNNLPFCGGAIGYFSYDFAQQLYPSLSLKKSLPGFPEAQIGIYDQIIIVDHQEKKAWYLNNQDPRAKFANLLARYPEQSFSSKTLNSLYFKSNLSFDQYHQAFTQIKEYLFAGDCYQINFSQRFCADFDGDIWPIYHYLCKINPAPYTAFLRFPQVTVLSFSPEQFLSCDRHGQVQTCPIKGTIARNTNWDLDRLQQQQLLNSKKDQAENVMIVDLLRNDFGKVCKYGSITVPQLFALQTFKNVHHLVSCVQGQLQTGYTSIDLFKACFPGGSITGAPKLRAMEIIEELEPSQRGIYCGSIFYFSYDGQMDSNIAIRTMYQYQGKIYCSAGGAIVTDSNLHSEYQECFDKVDILLKHANS